MMRYTWIIEGKLAQGPLPTISDIPELASLFDVVVVLVMPRELPGGIDYYVSMLTSYGLEVVYMPTPDFHPLQLLELYKLSKIIDEKIRENRKVFVHCMGGVGRSSLVTASYLVFMGHDLFDSVRHVRTRVCGALDNIGQSRMLEDFYMFIKLLGRESADKLFEVGERIGFGKGIRHSSKSVQLSIELGDVFSLDQKELKTMISGAMLHCIDPHGDDVINLLRGELPRCFEAKRFAERVLDIVLNYKYPGNDLLKLIVYSSHLLDYYFDQRVVFTDYEKISDKIYLNMYCDQECKELVDLARPYIEKAVKLLGKSIVIETISYMDAI